MQAKRLFAQERVHAARCKTEQLCGYLYTCRSTGDFFGSLRYFVRLLLQRVPPDFDRLVWAAPVCADQVNVSIGVDVACLDVMRTL